MVVWGGFSGDRGRAGLFFLPKNVMMNGYIKVLSDYIVTMFELHQCSHFMHDSTPYDEAKKVTKWLQTKKIEALEWPGISPDLNPIENCWHHMKSKTNNLGVLKQVITTAQHLATIHKT